MTEYKIGDKVVIVKDLHIWSRGMFPNTSVLTVVEDDDYADNYVNYDDLTIELGGVNAHPEDFKLVDAPFGGFVGVGTGLIEVEQTVRADPNDLALPENVRSEMLNKYRETIKEAHEGKESGFLGVYRPNLEDRKVGKVRVELVDDGFPLALREIAKVMTWAQTAKGYKDHDWQNLPNPEQGLAGATSRHRTDHIIQRQVGKAAAIECTDHESDILHKAHEAFGVLAQLELILRGKIK